MAQRSDPEKHRAQVRAANRARYRALQRLVDENQARFDVLYSEEADREGVTPKPRGRIDAVAIQAQIADLQARLAAIKSDSSASS
jgi:hypothetical protein